MANSNGSPYSFSSESGADLPHIFETLLGLHFFFLIQRRVTKVLQVQVFLSLYKGDNDQSQQSEEKIKPIFLLSQSNLACQQRRPLIGEEKKKICPSQVPGYLAHGEFLLHMW